MRFPKKKKFDRNHGLVGYREANRIHERTQYLGTVAWYLELVIKVQCSATATGPYRLHLHASMWAWASGGFVQDDTRRPVQSMHIA